MQQLKLWLGAKGPFPTKGIRIHRIHYEASGQSIQYAYSNSAQPEGWTEYDDARCFTPPQPTHQCTTPHVRTAQLPPRAREQRARAARLLLLEVLVVGLVGVRVGVPLLDLLLVIGVLQLLLHGTEGCASFTPCAALPPLDGLTPPLVEYSCIHAYSSQGLVLYGIPYSTGLVAVFPL